jgi:tripartite-type tricarboxylate transporter receptor subunit TctC
MKLQRYLGDLVSLGLLCSLLMTQTGHAQSVAEFYAGRSINVYIGFSPGGAYDIYARLLARFMGSHLPGQPKLVPQSMAGAGGLRAATFLYNVAAKDGTAIGMFSRGLVTAPLLTGAPLRFQKFLLAWQCRPGNRLVRGLVGLSHRHLGRHDAQRLRHGWDGARRRQR